MVLYISAWRIIFSEEYKSIKIELSSDLLNDTIVKCVYIMSITKIYVLHFQEKNNLNDEIENKNSNL